jgi:hypothetical protein
MAAAPYGASQAIAYWRRRLRLNKQAIFASAKMVEPIGIEPMT